MSGISYSQMPSSQSQVFAGKKGESWKFFVEATAVRGRPALIRKIIKNGGAVVNSAREADVLLAENNTKEALELFEGWYGDKILLSTRWVARCLEEQAFLGRDRGWAGCEFTRDGLLQGIIVNDDASEAEEEEVSQHLKRPSRTTTSFQVSKKSPIKRSSGAEPSPKAGPSRRLCTSPTIPTQSRKATFNAEQVNDHEPPNLSANSPSQSSGKTPHYQNPTLPMDRSLETSPPSTQTTLQQQQQALFAAMLGNLTQSSQQPLSPNILHSLGQYSNLPQPSPLLSPAFQQFFAQQLALNSFATNSCATEQPGLGTTQLPGFGAPSGSTEKSSTRPTPDDLDTDLVSDVPSVTSEEGEVELSISRRDGGKGRPVGGPSSDRQVQTALQSNPPRSTETTHKKPTGLFVDGRGMPKQFYIMVDIKNRKDLLKIIRKHNGKIVSKMADADYIILNNRSNQFQKALSMLPAHKIALSPAWLEECENMGKITELAPHIIDVSSGVGQGVSRRKPTKTRPFIREECESEDDVSQSIGTNMVLPISNTQPENRSNTRARSQSPLPPTNITPTIHGKCLFTEEDRIWFFKYARFKLERDPQMSNRALMRDIARKAPHHPVTSWQTSVRTKWPEEMEALKREIALLRGQVNKALPLTSSPTTPGKTQNELLYPESSPTPGAVQPSLTLPTSSMSTSSSSQPKSIFTTPLKRREHPTEDQVEMLATDHPTKKFKTTPVDVADVNSYTDGWITPI